MFWRDICERLGERHAIMLLIFDSSFPKRLAIVNGDSLFDAAEIESYLTSKFGQREVDARFHVDNN